MKLKMTIIVLALHLIIAFAQVDKATGTSTNDATMARLRVSNCIFGGPHVGIFINGKLAEPGGLPQASVPPLFTWGYSYLTPGTYTVAVAPTGKGIEEAMMKDVVVEVKAGHRYTVVMLGQKEDTTHAPLIIDETEAQQAIGATPTNTPHMTVNNIVGPAEISFILDGKIREDHMTYGEYQAALWPTGKFTGLDLSFRDADNKVIGSDGFSDESFNPPGDWLDCVGGKAGVVEQDWYNYSSQQVSSLSLLEYLNWYTSVEGSPATFNTFVQAIEAAGLGDSLTNGGPFIVYAPTDVAFARLPKDQLDALLADPQALADLARYHISEGYYPAGNLPGSRNPDLKLTLTNLLGSKFELRVDMINGTSVERLDNLIVKNGTRLTVLDSVLMPPTQ